jgi:hypothetical protein
MLLSTVTAFCDMSMTPSSPTTPLPAHMPGGAHAQSSSLTGLPTPLDAASATVLNPDTPSLDLFITYLTDSGLDSVLNSDAPQVRAHHELWESPPGECVGTDDDGFVTRVREALHLSSGTAGQCTQLASCFVAACRLGHTHLSPPVLRQQSTTWIHLCSIVGTCSHSLGLQPLNDGSSC